MKNVGVLNISHTCIMMSSAVLHMKNVQRKLDVAGNCIIT